MISSFMFSFTVLTVQFVTCIILFSKSKYIFGTLFSFFSLFELILIYFANKKHQVQKRIIDIYFLSGLILSIILLVFSITITADKQDTLSLNIPIIMKHNTSFFDKATRLLTIKFAGVKIEKFHEFIEKTSMFTTVILAKVWFFAIDTVRSWSFFNFDPYEENIKNFYYFGTSISLVLFSASLYFQYFFLTYIFYIFSINFMSVFACFGVFLLFNHDSFFLRFALFVAFMSFGKLTFIAMFFIGSLNPVFKIK